MGEKLSLKTKMCAKKCLTQWRHTAIGNGRADNLQEKAEIADNINLRRTAGAR